VVHAQTDAVDGKGLRGAAGLDVALLYSFALRIPRGLSQVASDKAEVPRKLRATPAPPGGRRRGQGSGVMALSGG